jgi:hypothetical protein
MHFFLKSSFLCPLKNSRLLLLTLLITITQASNPNEASQDTYHQKDPNYYLEAIKNFDAQGIPSIGQNLLNKELLPKEQELLEKLNLNKVHVAEDIIGDNLGQQDEKELKEEECITLKDGGRHCWVKVERNGEVIEEDTSKSALESFKTAGPIQESIDESRQEIQGAREVPKSQMDQVEREQHQDHFQEEDDEEEGPIETAALPPPIVQEQEEDQKQVQEPEIKEEEDDYDDEDDEYEYRPESMEVKGEAPITSYSLPSYQVKANEAREKEETDKRREKLLELIRPIGFVEMEAPRPTDIPEESQGGGGPEHSEL